jgi:hypothetical protein
MAGGQDDRWYGREALEPLANGESIVTGKVHVQKDHIRPKCSYGIDGADAIGRLADHPKSIAFEHLAHDEPEGRVIVNDQDAAHVAIVAPLKIPAPVPALDLAFGSRAYPSERSPGSRARIDDLRPPFTQARPVNSITRGPGR